jgi:hypothetical protein
VDAISSASHDLLRSLITRSAPKARASESRS